MTEQSPSRAPGLVRRLLYGRFSGRAERWLHMIFELSLVAKAIFATVELLSGIAVWLVPAHWVVRAVDWLTAEQLIDNPDDAIAAHLHQLAQDFALGGQQFWALYLLSHAVVKLAVVIGLALRWRLAFPASIWVLLAFMAYQTERFIATGSLLMMFLNVVDVVVIWLIWHEYQSVRKRPHGGG